ncbi:MAG: hypothetical protein AAFP03_17155, partial [Cyanobacteria bacterium J06598_3]
MSEGPAADRSGANRSAQSAKPAPSAKPVQSAKTVQSAKKLTTLATAQSVTARPQTAWRRFKRDRMAVFGTVVLLLTIAAVVIGPELYTVPFGRIDFAQATQPPSWQHPLGTNDLGQDQLSRLLWGGRISLAVGITAMLVSISLGTLIGSIAGFCGGA